MLSRPLIAPLILLFGLAILFESCKENKESKNDVATEEEQRDSVLPLEQLNLPEGFEISIYAEGVDEARSMAMGDDGTLFVGTRTANRLYAILDLDGDFKADKTIVLDTTLETPNGVAFKNGALYVAEVNRLLRYDDIEQQLSSPPEPEVIYDDYPDEFHHGWKYIAFGPDDKLYVPVGAPCNICDSTVVDERYASI
ncbi:MAG: sorbosone dehydrogenase family protein, partial [Flavobacteriaceae bacterium]